MAATDVVDLLAGANLGEEFDQGNIEADKLRLKIDGTSLQRAADGTLSSVAAPIPGLEVESLAFSTTNGAAWANKLVGNFTPTVSGLWLVEVSYMWNHNNTGNDFRARLLRGGTALGSGALIHQQEPKDVAGNIGGTGSNQQMQGYYRSLLAMTAGTAEQFTLQFSASADGVDTSMWDALLTVTKR